MKIRVLLFGATADIAGFREAQLEIETGSKVSDVLALMAKDHPFLRSHKVLFSANQSYVASNYTVEENDEIAIFTPVSGG